MQEEREVVVVAVEVAVVAHDLAVHVVRRRSTVHVARVRARRAVRRPDLVLAAPPATRIEHEHTHAHSDVGADLQYVNGIYLFVNACRLLLYHSV